MTSMARIPEVGRRLAAARLQRGLSQATIARRAGIAPSYLSRIENSKIQPGFRMALRLARALDAPLEEIASFRPSVAAKSGASCPVSAKGQCLLELIQTEEQVRRRKGGETYTPRQIRLLSRLAAWMREVAPERLRAMEVLLEELTRRPES